MGRLAVVCQSIAAIPIAFYGYAFHKVCISAHSLPALAAFEIMPLLPTGALYGGFCLILSLLTFIFGTRRVIRMALPCGAACQIFSIASIAVFYADQAREGALLLLAVGAVAQAIGTISLSALWFDLYAHLNPVRAIFCNAVSIVVAQTIIFFVEANLTTRILLMIVVGTLLTCICYVIGRRDTQKWVEKPGSVQGMSHERFLFPYKAVACIAAYSFAYDVAVVSVDVAYTQYAAIVPNLIVIVFVFVNSKKFNISVLFKLALPLMIMGSLFVAVLPGFAGTLSATLLFVGFAAVEILLFLMVCTISYSTGTSAIWLFGILGATQFIMRFVGVQVGAFAQGLGDSTPYIVLVIIAVVLVIVVSFMLMSEKNLFSFWHARDTAVDDDEGPSQEATSDYVKTRIASLSESYGLTDREIEVFYLLAQGKTNIQIAHDMFISEGTVKAHLHHIYQKVGVHTRKELMALVGE